MVSLCVCVICDLLEIKWIVIDFVGIAIIRFLL